MYWPRWHSTLLQLSLVFANPEVCRWTKFSGELDFASKYPVRPRLALILTAYIWLWPSEEPKTDGIDAHQTWWGYAEMCEASFCHAGAVAVAWRRIYGARTHRGVVTHAYRKSKFWANFGGRSFGGECGRRRRIAARGWGRPDEPHCKIAYPKAIVATRHL
jgi:hypothetical protein